MSRLARAAVVLWVALAGPLVAASGVDRYRVTINTAATDDAVLLMRQLAAMSRARIESEAEPFVVVASEASLRVLRSDPRVLGVEKVAEANATQTWETGSYAYDGAGNIKSIGTDRFRYDAFGRLTSGMAGGETESYTYDRFGNMVTIESGRTTLRFGPSAQSNRLTGTTQPGTTLPSNAWGTYDAAGQLTQWNSGGTFEYDAVGMIVTAKGVPGAPDHRYLYTASDERLATITMSNGAEVAAEWTLRDASGKVLRRITKTSENGAWKWTWKQDYIYLSGTLLAAEVATPAKTLHFFPDHLGTRRLITGNGGVELARHTYLPFGREVTPSYVDAEPMKFTGHERDDTALDYMHARYYSPAMGRFLSVDPVINSGAMSSPQMWNRYSYTANNPINRTDPDGRNWFNIDGTWEWHKGKTYTDADGKKHTSNYTHLLVAQAVGTTKTGATQFKLTLYNQNKVAATGSYFSGGGGHMRIPMGNYTIRGDIKDAVGPNAINPNSPLKNPPVFYGMQVIRNQPLYDSSTGNYYDVFGAYGPMRAYLNPWNPNIAGSTGNYLHGQAASGPAAHGYTHGCLCYGQDTTVINYLWKLGEKVPVSVDGSVDKP